MTEDEFLAFKILFSKYCRNEIHKAKCDDSDCEFCIIGHAYNEIFESRDLDDDE